MARRKKNLIGSFEAEGTDYTCSRWESWPPMSIILHEDARTVRALLGDDEFNRVRVWEEACGQLKMAPDKCLACPYVLADGVLVVEPGGRGYKPRTVSSTRLAQSQREMGKKK